MYSPILGTSLIILGLASGAYCFTLGLFENHCDAETRAAKVAVGVATVLNTAAVIDYKNGNLS